jgi:hypothetical protein
MNVLSAKGGFPLLRSQTRMPKEAFELSALYGLESGYITRLLNHHPHGRTDFPFMKWCVVVFGRLGVHLKQPDASRGI